MKKITLLLIITLAFASMSKAQVVEDFESITMNMMAGGAEDLSSFQIVPNPDPTGINASGMVVKFVRDKDGVPWGGFWSALANHVDVTTNKYVHVKVWKPRVSPVKFKLEGGDAGTLELASINEQTLTNAWEELVFDFSSKTGTYPVIAFMPDFEDPLTLAEDIIIYFDDLTVNNDPTVGTEAAYVIEDYEHIGLNYMLGGAEDLSTMTLIPNPDPSGINTSATVVQFVRDKDGVPWGGFWSALPVPVDVTTNKYVHVKVWKPRVSPIKFKLEGGDAGTLEAAAMNEQVLTGTWQDMVFDFSSKTGTYPVIAFMPDFEDPLALTDDIIIYFDDIIVNNDPNGIIPENQVLNVDMSAVELAEGEKVYVAGDFGGDYGTWAEPGSNTFNELTDPDGDKTYSIALNIADGTYHFKFFKGSGWDGGEWAGEPNRELTTMLFTPVTYTWGSLTSGIEIIPFKEQINAYPIPFTNSLTIDCPNRLKTLLIHSMYGQVVHRVDEVPAGANTMDLSSLDSGIYFITSIQEDGEKAIRKVIKN